MKYLKLSLLCLLLILSNALRSEADQSTLRAGVASMITPVSAVKYYQQVVQYLGKKLGMPAEMVHRTTYDEIDVMLEDGLVDFAFICSSPYVIDSDKFGVELLVAPLVNEEPFYHSNIIVHKESTIKTIDNLKDQSFAFVDPKSNTGRLYPTYVLAKKHETPEAFFSSTVYSYSHNKSCSALLLTFPLTSPTPIASRRVLTGISSMSLGAGLTLAPTLGTRQRLKPSLAASASRRSS